ncbi:MAG: LamG-like jellyroll fold domain-containing protein, partial [Pirellula sp.]
MAVCRRANSNDLYLFAQSGGTISGTITATGALSGQVGNWMHVAATVNSSNVATLYVNGANVGSVSLTGAINYSTWTSNRIGGSNWTADRLFRGAMDDIVLFDRALTSSEVSRLAASVNSASIAENSANGTNVVRVTAYDADTSDSVAYSIFSGNTNSTFTISASTGQITVADVTKLDFETTPVYTMVVRATDLAGGTSDQTVTINVTNVNESPVAVADTATAIEAGGISNGTAGTNPTGNVLTNDTDVDAGDTKTVSGVAAGTVGSASSNVGSNVTGTYGAVNIAANGAYTYTVDNSNAAVQALRTTANTLSDVFTYTMSDTAGLTRTTHMTLTIKDATAAPCEAGEATR